MNNQIVNLGLISIIGLTSCHQGKNVKGEKAMKPNIVWIVCEDMNPILGCYGDKLAKTPNIDKLASNGIVYRHAYASAPISAPARSCLITGVYPTSLGTQHLRQEQKLPSWMKSFPQYLSEEGYFTTNQNKTDFNFSAEGVFNYLGENLYPWRQRSEGQPFFSFFNIGDTHEGRVNFLENYEKVTASLSPEQFTSPDSVILTPYYPDTPEMRKIWARYYDLAAAMDMKVGQILKNLEEDGLMENTIVFFFSDHGHGLPRYKRWLNITGLHVPLVVKVPDKYRHLVKNKPGTDNTDLVSFIDFAPTVINLAGIEIPKHMNGKPFLGENIPQAPHEFLFAARSRADDMFELSRAIHESGKAALQLVPDIKSTFDKLAVEPGNRKPQSGATRVYRDSNFASFTGWALEGALQEMGVEPKLKY